MSNKLPNRKSLAIHYIALVAAYVLWAAASPVIKLTLDYIPPNLFLLFRFSIVCILLLPYTITVLRRTAIYKGDLVKIALLGVFSQTSIILIFEGLKYTSAIEATLIGLMGPVLSVTAGHYFYHEKVDTKIKAGLLLAMLGTIFVAFEPILNPSPIAAETHQRIVGNTFVVLYSISFLLYIIWSKISMGQSSRETKRVLNFIHIKPMRNKYSATLLTVLSFYVGLITIIPFALLEHYGYFGTTHFTISNLSLTPIAGILYMAVFSSIAAYLLFEWSLEEVDVKDTAIFSYLQPIFTLPFAYILLKELPNSFMIVGAIIIAAGVAIAESKKS